MPYGRHSNDHDLVATFLFQLALGSGAVRRWLDPAIYRTRHRGQPTCLLSKSDLLSDRAVVVNSARSYRDWSSQAVHVKIAGRSATCEAGAFLATIHVDEFRFKKHQ